jgi:hypothetical protein
MSASDYAIHGTKNAKEEADEFMMGYADLNELSAY